MTDPDDGAASDTTVAGVAHRFWGVKPSPAIPRYSEPGKTVDPQFVVPPLPESTDTRVGFPDSPDFDSLRGRLSEAGVAFRAVAHWIEEEWITSVDPADRTLTALQVAPSLSAVAGLVAEPVKPLVGEYARAALDAFALLWDLHEPIAPAATPEPVPAENLVPRDWLRFLP